MAYGVVEYIGSVAMQYETTSFIAALDYEIEIREGAAGSVNGRFSIGTNYHLKTLTVSYAGQSKTYTMGEYGGIITDHEYLFPYVKNKYQITFTAKTEEGYTVYFRPGDDANAEAKSSWVLGEDDPNRLPTASISVPALYAGRDAKITWSTYDEDGNTVYAVSLVRYMKKTGQNSFTGTTLISSETTRTTFTDTIPADAGGAEIYYYLGFTDKIGATQYKQSSTVKVYTNTAPTAPGSILVSGDVSGSVVTGGGSVTVTWAQASDVDGNLSGYELERQEDGGSWAQIYKGTLREHTVAVTEGKDTVRYRVRAYDSMGEYSAYTVSSVYTVNNNKAPTVSISNIVTDGSIGVFNQATGAPEINYTVTDQEGSRMQVEEYLDGVLLRSAEVTSGSRRTISFAGEAWLKILNGVHTVRIVATDADGSVGNVEVRFAKDMDVIEVQLKSAMESASSTAPTMIMVNIQGIMPDGSVLLVEACNNANDASPTWENITSAVISREKHIFQNSKKTASKWAIGLRVKLERGDAESVCAITSIGGNWK